MVEEPGHSVLYPHLRQTPYLVLPHFRPNFLTYNYLRILSYLELQSSTDITMGVEKTVLSEGNGSDTPKKGDTVTMEYTGWLHDTSKPENKGNQ
jgi:hypothetical protein